MRSASAKFAMLLLCLWAWNSPNLLADKNKRPVSADGMNGRQRAVHALNRLTFGPRPGDVQRVLAVGVDKWINLQLHPEKIDDSTAEARIAPFRTLRMTTREIVENFPDEQMVKAVMNGKRSMPSDPAERAVYRAQIERIEAREERKQGIADNAGNASAANGDPTAKPALAENASPLRGTEPSVDLNIEQLLDLPPDQRMKEVLKMSPAEQEALANQLKGGKRQAFLEGMNAKQKETLEALNNPQRIVVEELMQAKLLRAIYSERQLQEVMTDFWLNHFNVFIGKGADRFLLTSYERDVIRPHALGKFEDLLVATAKSPAMLFYLDNWLSVGPDSDVALGIPKNPSHAYMRRRFPPNVPRQRARAKRSSGLNENYGRELMELHTLSVNGGYTQNDVTEVAKVFTGWTIDRPQDGGGFKFEPRMHGPGDKFVLGHRIKPKGEREGLEVLHLLAENPKTAHFIALKLATRFVSDQPPESLVDQMAHTYLKKHGDIREVLKTLFQSPEFWSEDVYRAKVKTPLEFVASAARATGADVNDAMVLTRQLNNLGMPLYGMQPPTGYSMKAETWVNSSALLGRMNLSLALANGRLKGVQVDPVRWVDSSTPLTDATLVLAQLESSFLSGDVSPQTHDTIAARLQDPKISQRKLDDPARPANIGMIAGLLLGSPEFQRR